MGGEEFAVILPGHGQMDAMALAECIRQDLCAINWSDLALGLEVTASIGVVGSPGRTGSEMIAEADRRLYAAKAAGRNCVVGEPGGDTDHARPKTAALSRRSG